MYYIIYKLYIPLSDTVLLIALSFWIQSHQELLCAFIDLILLVFFIRDVKSTVFTTITISILLQIF